MPPKKTVVVKKNCDIKSITSNKLPDKVCYCGKSDKKCVCNGKPIEPENKGKIQSLVKESQNKVKNVVVDDDSDDEIETECEVISQPIVNEPVNKVEESDSESDNDESDDDDFEIEIKPKKQKEKVKEKKEVPNPVIIPPPEPVIDEEKERIRKELDFFKQENTKLKNQFYFNDHMNKISVLAKNMKLKF